MTLQLFGIGREGQGYGPPKEIQFGFWFTWHDGPWTVLTHCRQWGSFSRSVLRASGKAQCQLSFQGLRSNWINNRKVKRTTYSNSVPKARARLGAGSTYVVTNTGVLTGCTVEVCNWAWAVCPWKSSGPGGIGACRGSGCAKIRLSTVAIQDWCAENKARYEARSRACTSITKPNTPNKNKKQPRSNF